MIASYHTSSDEHYIKRISQKLQHTNMANSTSPKAQLYFLLIFSVITLLISTLTSSSSIGGSSNSKNHVALFVFGDSLFDVGNNNYLKNAVGQANFWPYGRTYFEHPTGRFSDGRVIPDFIAEYLNLPLIPPYLQLKPDSNYEVTNGVNFASGGAGALVETHGGQVVNLHTQLRYFKKVKKQIRQQLGEEQTKKLLSRAIYLFSIGGNDYTSPFIKQTNILHSYSFKQYVKTVIGNITFVVREVHREGGRKFGFLKLPVLYSLPFIKAALNQDSLKNVTKLANGHNREFSKVLKEQEKLLKGFKYAKFDLYTSLSKRINNPSQYGFKEVNLACCGAGAYRGELKCGSKVRGVKEYQLCDDWSEYIFFEGAHPTEKVYDQFAKLMWSGGPDVIRPRNLQELLDA